jgi:hypothetical protein
MYCKTFEQAKMTSGRLYEGVRKVTQRGYRMYLWFAVFSSAAHHHEGHIPVESWLAACSVYWGYAHAISAHPTHSRITSNSVARFSEPS